MVILSTFSVCYVSEQPFYSIFVIHLLKPWRVFVQAAFRRVESDVGISCTSRQEWLVRMKDQAADGSNAMVCHFLVVSQDLHGISVESGDFDKLCM